MLMITMSDFDTEKYIKDFYRKAKKEISGKIVIAVSGGVDSTTSATLLKNSGVDYEVLLIDTGYMRKDEVKEVKSVFKRLGYSLSVIDKKKEFYSALKGISNPEEKRNIFREKYFKIFTEYLTENNIKFIAQGTQFWKNKSKIYHNCPTELFNKQKLKIIEPVAGLSKNKIRRLAKKLELPDEIVNRRPFPGPGLLIRFGGDFNLEKLKTIQNATLIVDKFVEKYKDEFSDCYQIFPYFCDCSPVTYINKNNCGKTGNIILIRAIRQRNKNNTTEYHPFIINEILSKKLINELMQLSGIGRICFDMTPKMGFGNNIKPGATIEYI
jgi:GMP synthase (glutamine-hydrolysing) B subunit